MRRRLTFPPCSRLRAPGSGYGTGVSGGRTARLDGTAAAQGSGRRRVTRAYRTEVGGSWWVALVVVTVALGLVGRSAGGFWSPFLWSVVAFVLGSLVAIAVSAARVPARSEGEAFADVPRPARGRSRA